MNDTTWLQPMISQPMTCTWQSSSVTSVFDIPGGRPIVCLLHCDNLSLALVAEFLMARCTTSEGPSLVSVFGSAIDHWLIFLVDIAWILVICPSSVRSNFCSSDIPILPLNHCHLPASPQQVIMHEDHIFSLGEHLFPSPCRILWGLVSNLQSV